MEGRFVAAAADEPPTSRRGGDRPGRRAAAGPTSTAAGDRRRAGRALGALLVDLHGQHAHQSLLPPAAQRDALDRFGRRRPRPLRAARVAVHDLVDELAALGGDERAAPASSTWCATRSTRSRPPPSPARRGRDLEAEEDVLADAAAHREAALAVAALSGDGDDAVVDGRRPAPTRSVRRWRRWPGGARSPAEERLRALAAEVADVADERAAGETIDEDPERLEQVRERRQLLHELRRKYGETLADVVAEGERLQAGWPSSRATTHAPPSSTPSWRGPGTRPRSPRGGGGAPRRRPRAGRRIQANLVELAMPKAVRSPSRSRATTPATTSRCCSPPTPGRRRCPSPRWPRVASWRDHARVAPRAHRRAAHAGLRRGRRRHRRRGRGGRGPGAGPARGASTRCWS